MFQSPPWQSLRRDSPSGTGKELSHGTTTEPSKGTNNSQGLPPDKDTAPTQSTATALTGVVPGGDGSTVTTAAKAQHAKQQNTQKTAATSGLTKTGAGNKPMTKVTTRTLDATGSAKRLATSGEIGAKGQCNAKPVGTKLQRAPAVTNPVQSTQENTATTSNSTSPTKRVSTQSATKSNTKTSVVKACPNSVNAAVGARLAAAPTVRPASTGAMLTTTKVTESKQSTIGDGAKSVETSKGNMKVKSNTKLTAAVVMPTDTVTKAKSVTHLIKPVTTSVRAKTSSTSTTKQVSPKAVAKTVGATKTTNTKQSVGTATKKTAAKATIAAKPTTTKGSGKPVGVHQPGALKPSTTMPSGAQLDAHKVTPVVSTAGAKTVASSSGGITAKTTAIKPEMVVTCQITTTTVTTKTPSRTKTTTSAPSAASLVKHSATMTGTVNAKPTTNSANTEPNRGRLHPTPSVRDADTSQIISPQAAATTCTQGVSTASGSHAKITESSLSTMNSSSSGKSRSLLADKGTAADRNVGTAAVAENKAYVMSPTVAQSQLEVTQSIDVAMVMPSTVLLPETTQCDKVDALVSSTASQLETIHRNYAVSSVMSSKVQMPIDDLEKEVIYSEEQTVSLAMVTTKSDMVDMPSGDTVQEDNNRSSLLTDRLEAVPLSPVSDTLLLLIIFNNSSSSIYFGAY